MRTKTKSKQVNQFASYDRATVAALHARTGEDFTAVSDLSITRGRIARLEAVDGRRLSKRAQDDLAKDLKKYRDWETTLIKLFPELK